MHFRLTTPLPLLTLLAAFTFEACGADEGYVPSADASVNDAEPAQTSIDSGTPSSIRGIAVVGSDYSSSSVSLLDREGKVVKDGCFHSGTGGVGLTMTLSGDVVLPTQLPLDGPIIVIDRTNAALTWLDAKTCMPIQQLAVGTGFKSNPHDVVVLSANKAYVTRMDENAKATVVPEDFDDGNDLLVIDPSQPTIIGRIDLKPFAPATNILPRADRALLVEDKVFVSLNAYSADFANYGTGRIVMVDPNTDQVSGVIDLPDVKNCGAMTYLSAERKLFITCGGAFGDSAGQANGSAIVVVDLASTPPAVTARLAAAGAGGIPFTNTTVAVLDTNNILAVTMGDFSGLPPDRLWSLSAHSSLQVFESAESFSLGAVLVDAEKGRVLLADGTTTSIALLRVFDVVAGQFTQSKTIKTHPTQKFPPRSLCWF